MGATERMQRGAEAESVAQDYLEMRGLKVVERNYRCRVGELDLVLTDNEMLVIAEVRFRSNTGFASPQETVDRKKQAKLIRATQHFLQSRPALRQYPVRFDVVAVSGLGKANEVNWIKHAFSAD